MKLTEQALEQLNHFCANSLSQYARARNFDYGPLRRENVSQLSKYRSEEHTSELQSH